MDELPASGFVRCILRASLSGTFLQGRKDVVNQCLEFGADGVSRLEVAVLGTLPTSLSGTFLQTLPDLVTPLKGHSLLRAASCPPTAVSALRKVRVPLNVTQCRSNIAPKRHSRKHEAHPPQVKKEFVNLDSNNLVSFSRLA